MDVSEAIQKTDTSAAEAVKLEKEQDTALGINSTNSTENEVYAPEEHGTTLTHMQDIFEPAKTPFVVENKQAMAIMEDTDLSDPIVPMVQNPVSSQQITLWESLICCCCAKRQGVGSFYEPPIDNDVELQPLRAPPNTPRLKPKANHEVSRQ